MKTVAILLTAAALAAPAAAYAGCGAEPMWPSTTLSATPTPVTPGAAVTFRGSAWGIGENCSRTVVLSLKAVRGALGIQVGDGAVDRNGSFKLHWTVPADEQLGKLRIVARQDCRSGNDGSGSQIEKTMSLRIWRPTA